LQEDGFLWANLLTIATENAAKHIDFKLRGFFLNIASFQVHLGSGRRDAYGLGRADKLTELARDTLGAVFRVLYQIGCPTISLGNSPFFLWILHGDLLAKKM
jgi:hypothetical protein